MMSKKRYNGFFKFCAYFFAVVFTLGGWVTAEYIYEARLTTNTVPMLFLSIGAWGIVVSCIVFIVIGAGRKNKDKKIHLAHADYLFTEFWIFITGALVIGAYSLDYYCINRIPSKAWQIVLEYLLVESCALLLLLCIAGIVRRMKGGVLFKNSASYILMQEISHSRWYQNISSVWRISLLLLVYGIISVLLILLGHRHPAVASMLSLLVSVCYISGFSAMAYELEVLRKGAEEIASGNLDYKVNNHTMIALTNSVAKSLNDIGVGMQHALDEQVKSERFKSELITNVSHDIKTPLTSIISYADLLKMEKIDNPKAVEYVNILDKKCQRLKNLIEDLVEASKVSTGNVNVDLQPTDAKELLNQAVGEFDDKLADKNLQPIVTMPKEDVIVMADGRHLWRVIDNMLGNVCKYSMENSRVYIDLLIRGKKAVIEIKNISVTRLNISEDDLMGRFVRGDSSRNTNGSGLGLSIAKSLTEIQGGKFDIKIDGDLFKAIVQFDLAASAPLSDAGAGNSENMPVSGAPIVF